MPALQPASEVIAILCSDLHFSHAKPLFRADEDWYNVMAFYIDQLKSLQKTYNCHIVAAGDICHHWKEPPQLVNFLLDKLPVMYAVPGQHDLPLHNLKDVHKSVYWTLVEAGKLIHLEHGKPRMIDHLILHGFPFGTELTANKESSHTFGIHLAVVHHYVWRKGCSFPDAPSSSRAIKLCKKLSGYDAAVFGDNHIHFSANYGYPMMNCGTFMRRRKDEQHLQPSVGLLTKEGKIKRCMLDTSVDRFNEAEALVKAMEEGLEIEGFVEELLEGMSGADFAEVVKQYLTKNKVRDSVRQLILRSINQWQT